MREGALKYLTSKGRADRGEETQKKEKVSFKEIF